MNLFELAVRIGVDDQASKKLSDIAGKLGKGLKKAAKIGTSAIATAAAGITALTTEAVKNFAEYEQLTGGIATMFEDLSYDVEQYAKNAYKTAGMSANQYMETVMGFSASLTQSLKASEGDISRAADLANQTIIDMADNANKMGTSIEMIQNAYQGFAKQNYTMLDNLKLGYGGTKSEMERLIADANAVKEANGEMADLSIDSFADIVEAIHIMQDEMGIAGTTAAEAEDTISGSIASMKAAWQNLVVGMADENADMGSLVDNFVESTKTAADQLLPTINQTLSGIGDLIVELAPVIGESLPTLIEEVLPSLLEAAVSLVTALVDAIIEALPALGEAVLSATEILLTDVFGVSEENASAFSEGVRNAFTGIGDAFTSLVESAQTEGTWLNEVWTGLQEAASALGEFLTASYNAIVLAFQTVVTAAQTDGTYLNVIWETIKTAISAAIGIITGVIKVFTAVLQGDWAGAWEAVKSVASTVWDAICSIVMSIVDYISGFLGTMVEKGSELISKLSEGIQNTFAELFALVSGWVTDNIINPIKDMGSNLMEAGKEILGQFWDGMKSVWEKIKSWWDGLIFSEKEIPVGSPGEFATGLSYVPFDEYPALLHRGEAVLTKAEADRWRQQGRVGDSSEFGSGMIVINQYIQTVPQTPVEFANTTEAYFEQARWML